MLASIQDRFFTELRAQRDSKIELKTTCFFEELNLEALLDAGADIEAKDFGGENSMNTKRRYST